MRKVTPELRDAFRAELRRKRETQREWAAREGITYVHLYLVLTGQRESQRLTAKIADYARNSPALSAA